MNIVDTSMIVTYTDKGWEIITQRTHGLLAAQIASNWRVKDRSRRWLETMLAIAEHDDAQIELERDDLLTELGGPFNFDMRRFDLDHCKRTYEFSISKSRYIAVLNLMHLQFVYGKEVKNDLSALKLMTRVSRDIRQFRGSDRAVTAEYVPFYDSMAISESLAGIRSMPEGAAMIIGNERAGFMKTGAKVICPFACLTTVKGWIKCDQYVYIFICSWVRFPSIPFVDAMNLFGICRVTG